MSSYSFSDDAIQDLEEICEYIAQNNAQAASRLFERIREKSNFRFWILDFGLFGVQAPSFNYGINLKSSSPRIHP